MPSLVNPRLHRSPRASVGLIAFLVAASLMFGFVARAQPPQQTTRVAGANWKQATKYSDAFLKQFTYSLSVEPQWIGKSDAFWYEYRTSQGKQWYKVQPKEAKKEPARD